MKSRLEKHRFTSHKQTLAGGYLVIQFYTDAGGRGRVRH